MANIIDLKTYQPSKGEKFFVDSNVWYWFTYVSSKEMYVVKKPRPYQISDYSSFIEKALNVGALLYNCPLSFAELSSIIERAELDYYNQIKQTNINLKQYRSIKAERNGVSKEINSAWSTISSMSKHMVTQITNEYVNEILANITNNTLDTYDNFYTLLMKANDIRNIITDDADFQSCNYSNVFTSNARLV